MSHTWGSRAVITAVLVPALWVLTSCGSDPEEASDPTEDPSSPSSESSPVSPSPSPSETKSRTEPTTEPVPEGARACEQVWVEGRELPFIYPGCVEGETFVARDALGCSSGQRIVRYADQYYAVPGGVIREATPPLAENRAYRDAVAQCRG